MLNPEFSQKGFIPDINKDYRVSILSNDKYGKKYKGFTKLMSIVLSGRNEKGELN